MDLVRMSQVPLTPFNISIIPDRTPVMHAVEQHKTSFVSLYCVETQLRDTHTVNLGFFLSLHF